MPRIAAILIYPVEGCRGIRVKSCGLSARGLEGDRLWTVAIDGGDALSAEAERILGKVWIEQKGPELWATAAGMDRLLLSAAEAPAWFTRLLARPMGCVEQAHSGPLVATTTASLAALNQQLAQSVTLEAFRPNLVIEGTDPFVEETWGSVKVGGVQCAVSANPHSLRPQFGIRLTPELTGSTAVQLRAGQGIDALVRQ